jgi:hypothetical protein
MQPPGDSEKNNLTQVDISIIMDDQHCWQEILSTTTNSRAGMILDQQTGVLAVLSLS